MIPRILVIGLTALFVSTGALLALAGTGCWGPGMHGGPALSSLSSKQQKKVEDLRLEYLKKTEQLRSQIRQKNLELMELSRKTDADPKAVDKADRELLELRATMRHEWRAYDRELAKILPPEQRPRRGYMGHHHGMDHHGMDHPGCGWM